MENAASPTGIGTTRSCLPSRSAKTSHISVTVGGAGWASANVRFTAGPCPASAAIPSTT